MHRENSLSLAGKMNTTDPKLFVSSRAHQGIRCRAKRLGDAPERLALLSSINCLGSWRWSRAADEVRASKHARSIFGLDESAPLTRDWAANNSERRAAFNFTLTVTTGEGQQ
jgi:hypothetical protein